MVWVLFIALAVVLVAATAAFMTGRLAAAPAPDPVSSTPDAGLPADFRSSDIDDVRFDTALRGYRMDQVDEVLDRLYTRLRELESRPAEPGRPDEPGPRHPDTP